MASRSSLVLVPSDVFVFSSHPCVLDCRTYLRVTEI
jgi:hypothetical protein